MPKIEYEGKIIEGTEEQLTDFMSKLPSVQGDAPAKNSSSRMSPKEISDELGMKRDFGRDVASTAVGLVEGATGGLARPAINKIEDFLGVDVPDGNLIGNMAGFVAGPGKLIRGATAPMQGIKFAGPALRGITEGAVGGFVAPTERGKELDVETRVGQAALGMAVGVAGEVLGAAFSGFGKFMNANKQIKDLSLAKEQLRINSGKVDVTQFDEQIRTLKSSLKDALKVQADSTKSQVQALSKQLKNEAETSAEAIKQPTLRYMREFRDQWGKNFDDLLSGADEAGLTVKELKQIEDEVLGELRDSGIELTGAPLRAIKSFSRQITKPEKSATLLNRFGKPLSSGENLDKVIPNMQVIQAKRSVSGALSSMSKTRGQYTPEDVAGVIFNKKIAQKLENNIDGLGALNEEYKKFSDLAKFAHKRLGSGRGEFEAPGASLIKNVATGKATKTEISAVTKLEQATGIKFTGKAKSIGTSIEDIQNLSKAQKQATITKFNTQIADLSKKKRDLVTTRKNFKNESLKLDQEILNLQKLRDGIAFGSLGKRLAENIAIGLGTGAAVGLFLNKRGGGD